MINQKSVHGMRWGVQVLPEVVVVKIFGELDHALEDMFHKVSNRAHALEKRKVVIDFSQSSSESSLPVILCGYGLHHMRQLGIPVACIGPPKALISILLDNGVKEIPEVFSGEMEPETFN